MRTVVMEENATKSEKPFRPPLLAALAGVFVALLLCVTLAGPAGADDDDDDGGEYVPRQVVVKIKPGASIGAIERKFGVSRIERLPGAGKIYLLRTRQGVNPATLANRMEQDSRVLYAEPNFRAGLPEASKYHRARPGGEPTPGSDPALYRAQYAVDSLNLTEAHAIERGSGSVVAVIDTGVQVGHPDISGRLTEARYDFVGDDGTPADVGNGRDDDRDGEVDETVGHGTHVAGIVALAAPQARIMPLRALDSEGRGTTFGVAEAIRYAVRNDADVVNLSLGSSRETELLEDLIGDDDDDDEAGKAVFVAAAGNDGNSIEQYPAAEDGAISVTSVGENGKRSGFANYGSWVSIAAPGDDIHSPFPVSRYATWDGTSMATPFVAAQAALIRSARPSASSECVTGIIQRTAEPLTVNLGAGHADVEASTKYAANPSNSCAGFGDDD